MRQYGGDNRRLAVDRLSFVATDALRERDLILADGEAVAEKARAVKSPEELVLMRASMAVCETACRDMQDILQPGITENALWAKLHETNIRLGGDGSRLGYCLPDRVPILGSANAPCGRSRKAIWSVLIPT